MRTRHALGVAVLLSWNAGCVGFIVPPARVESGLGTRVHAPRTAEGKPGSRATGVLRAGFHPLQLVGPEAPPWADVGFGYRSEWVLDETEAPLHGPYAELGLYPVRTRLGARTRFRFGGYTSADAFLTPARDPGLGATLGTLAEVTGFSSAAFGSSDEDDLVAGASYGQWAVGLFASTSFRNANGRFSQALTTGFSLRVPFVVGFACCARPELDWLGDSTSKVDRGSTKARRKRSEPKRRVYHPARPRRKKD